MAPFKIVYNEEECIGCGTCVDICPDNWELDEDEEKAHPKNTELDELGCNEEAAEECPTNCIEIEEV